MKFVPLILSVCALLLVNAKQEKQEQPAKSEKNDEEGGNFKGFHLTDENFDEHVGKDKHVLVKFYAPCNTVCSNQLC